MLQLSASERKPATRHGKVIILVTQKEKEWTLIYITQDQEGNQ